MRTRNILYIQTGIKTEHKDGGDAPNGKEGGSDSNNHGVKIDSPHIEDELGTGKDLRGEVPGGFPAHRGMPVMRKIVGSQKTWVMSVFLESEQGRYRSLGGTYHEQKRMAPSENLAPFLGPVCRPKLAGTNLH